MRWYRGVRLAGGRTADWPPGLRHSGWPDHHPRPSIHRLLLLRHHHTLQPRLQVPGQAGIGLNFCQPPKDAIFNFSLPFSIHCSLLNFPFVKSHLRSCQREKYICNGNYQISSEKKILLKKMLSITRQSALEKFSGRSLLAWALILVDRAYLWAQLRRKQDSDKSSQDKSLWSGCQVVHGAY